MRIHKLLISVMGILAAACLAVRCVERAVGQTADSPDAPQSRLMLHERPTGEKYFALSLVPPPETFQSSGPENPVDVVVLIDTSASQTGPYRTDSIASLRSLLASLDAGDRIRLLAVDLHAVDLSGSFAGPVSQEMRAAFTKLDQREPLGSTDLAAALRAAVKSFDPNAARARAVVYIGDGMTKANFFTSDEFAALTSELVAAQAPVHSYAIGPQRDLQLLAALANHTGGTLYVDATETHVAQQAGAALASVVHTPVFWPTQTQLPASLKEAQPRRTPPMRPDRETVLVGVFDGEGLQQIGIQGQVKGHPAEAQWSLSPESVADDLAFLPQLVDAGRGDGGATLPTVGMEGLREVGRLMLARAENLAKMGARELAGGDFVGAQKLIEAARKTDPNNPEAAALEKALQKAVAEAAEAEKKKRTAAPPSPQSRQPSSAPALKKPPPAKR
jgi:hypothetical protein